MADREQTTQDRIATSDALATLLRAVVRDRRVPLDWVVEHAPDGRLDELWARCDDASVLLDLAARVSDRAPLVRAACACAIAAAGDVAVLPPGLRAALEVADAWSRGDAPAVALDRLVVDARDAFAEVARAAAHRATTVDLDRAVLTYAAQAAYFAVQTATAPTSAVSVAKAASRALSLRATRDLHRAIATPPAPELAAVVRRHVPCPTIEALLDAVRGG